MTPQEVEEIKARHFLYKLHGVVVTPETCNGCHQRWPCDSARLVAEVERLQEGLRTILEEHAEIAKAGNYGSECCTCSPQDGGWPCVTALEARAALGGEE